MSETTRQSVMKSESIYSNQEDYDQMRPQADEKLEPPNLDTISLALKYLVTKLT